MSSGGLSQYTALSLPESQGSVILLPTVREGSEESEQRCKSASIDSSTAKIVTVAMNIHSQSQRNQLDENSPEHVKSGQPEGALRSPHIWYESSDVGTAPGHHRWGWDGNLRSVSYSKD